MTPLAPSPTLAPRAPLLPKPRPLAGPPRQRPGPVRDQLGLGRSGDLTYAEREGGEGFQRAARSTGWDVGAGRVSDAEVKRASVSKNG